MDTVYLIDGTSQLFRAFFAIRNLSNAEGLPTNAVFGFTSMLRKLLNEERPAFVGVAWDLEGPTFRHDRFADYKAQRPPLPADLLPQFDYAKEVCNGFRIPALELPGYEADDLIATYARLASEAGFPVVVVASDKDLLQLVGDGITVLNPSKDLRLDAAGVAAQFGAPPDRVIDVLGLMGDAVDNIPGVPGVGEKTALSLIAAHGGMEAILERAKRFVAAFAARDTLLLALEAEGVPLDAPRGAFVDAAKALLEIDRDPDLPKRLREAIERASFPGELTGKDRKVLVKVLKDLDKGSQRRTWQAISENAPQALLSRELATVDRNVPVSFDPETMRVGAPDREHLATLFKTLGFRSLTAEFSDVAPKAAVEAAVVAAAEGAADYTAIMTLADLDRAVAACRAAGRIAVDTETNSTDPMQAKLVGMSLSWAPRQGVYIPIGHAYLGVPDQLDLDDVRLRLAPLLADPSIQKVGQNLKYDSHVLRRHGMQVAGWVLDTMVAAFLLEPDRQTFNMDALAAYYLGHETIKYTSLVGTGAKQITLDQVSVEHVAQYAAEDADVTRRLADVLAPKLVSAGVEEVWKAIDGPILPILIRMEAAGIRIDVEALRSLSREMDVALDQERRGIHALAGRPFNVDSPKQLREVLFGSLGLATGKKTAKSGEFSTDASTLEALAEEHEIARRLLAYRELSKLKGTYVDTLPGLVNRETGRVHTSYHPTGAATGRLSSSDPNLQNIPARSPVGLRIRSAFVPEPGWTFLASDYSQVELRVLAHLCGDEGLTAAFQAGEDIHRVTAAKVFGVAPDAVTDDMRRRAKAVNFGILYGMSETRLARDQGMTRPEARAFIAAYFDRFKNIKAYIEGVRTEAMREGQVRTLFGRLRAFPALRNRGHRGEVEQALRAAVNTTIQGTAADLMKLAMQRVDRALAENGLRSRMLLQVHDELLLEVPEDEIDTARALVREAMENVHPLRVPLAVDQKTGGDWREVT
ncbi:MAG TPA: DNA polymerase I [Candidatus Polarisedimenticolaceae bacterium]|nr:DNA polymerase I [Candidatus Polarisedimenticolaceae bacterium]